MASVSAAADHLQRVFPLEVDAGAKCLVAVDPLAPHIRVANLRFHRNCSRRGNARGHDHQRDPFHFLSPWREVRRSRTTYKADRRCNSSILRRAPPPPSLAVLPAMAVTALLASVTGSSRSEISEGAVTFQAWRFPDHLIAKDWTPEPLMRRKASAEAPKLI
jgi:hypothetical protein